MVTMKNNANQEQAMKKSPLLLVLLLSSTLVACSGSPARDESTLLPLKEGVPIAYRVMQDGKSIWFYDGNCDSSAFAKHYPNNYVIKSASGDVLERGCYTYNPKTGIAVLAGDSLRYFKLGASVR